MRRNQFNDHHLAHNRAFWDAHEATGAIRNNPSLIITMGIRQHNLLHYMTAPVPTPSIHTAQHVANHLYNGLDPLSAIDEYSRLVEESIKHPKAKYIEKQLGMLSVEAMRAQIPYIEDSLITRRYL